MRWHWWASSTSFGSWCANLHCRPLGNHSVLGHRGHSQLCDTASSTGVLLGEVGSVIDLSNDVYTTRDGHTTHMIRLRSGHRAIHLFDFDITPWHLPPEHRVQGFDPFRIPDQSSSHSFLGGVMVDVPLRGSTFVDRSPQAGLPMDNSLFLHYLETHATTLPEHSEAESHQTESVNTRDDRQGTPTVRYSASERSVKFELDGIEELPSVEEELQASELPSEPAESAAPSVRERGASTTERSPASTVPALREESTTAMEPQVNAVLPVSRRHHGEGGEEESRDDDPEVPTTSNETTSMEAAPTIGGIDFFFEHFNGNVTFLYCRPGLWTGTFPTPADVRGGLPVPDHQVSSRRVIHMIAPSETFSTTGTSAQVLDSSWRSTPPRSTPFSWYGGVTFFEISREQSAGNPWSGRQRDGRPEDEPEDRDRGRSSDYPYPTATSSASGSNSLRPRGQSLGQKQRAVFDHLESSEFAGSQSEIIQLESSSRDVPVFGMDCTDHDDAWVLSPDVQACDPCEKSSEGFSLASLKNSLGLCAKRRPVHDRRSRSSSLMRRTLFQSAQAFVTRLLRSHGAQEEHAYLELSANTNSPDAAEGRCSDPLNASQDGRSEVQFSMGSDGEGTPLHAGDRPEPDGVGLPAGEGHHGRLHPGRRVPAGEGEGQRTKERLQENQGVLDSSRDWQPSSKIADTQALGQGSTSMSSCSRTPTVPGKSLQPMVGVPDVRFEMGEIGSRSNSFNSGEPARSSQGKELGNQRGKLSSTPTSTSVKTRPRESPTGTYTTWRSNLLEGSWGDWLRGASKEHQSYDQDDGSCQQRQQGQKVYVQGSQDDRPPSNSTLEDAGASLRDGQERAGDPGAGGRGGFSDMAGGGHEHGFQSRLLVNKEQLGGKKGSKLRSILERRFSKFMVFLCMNCCLNTAATTAFGSPEFTACYFADQFRPHHVIEPLKPLRTSTDFVNCYVYGELEQHFANSSVDTQGVTKPLHKEIKKMLVKNLKEQPNVMEVYCPPRLAEKAEKHGFACGGSLDLTTGWDFNLKSHQEAALRLINRMKPSLILLCPPRTTFSSLRHLSNFKRDPKVVAAEEAEGLHHLRFAVLIAKLQLRNGRGFLFEHPKRASSWLCPELQALRDEDGVFSVDVDLCRFGLTTTQGQPALKPTLLLTNIEELAIALGRRCEGHHKRHQPLLAGEAAHAAKYTPHFVENILRGLRLHMEAWTKSHQPERDYWETKPGVLIRHHRQPRRALFVPTGVSGCPHKVTELASSRTTYLHYVNGKKATFSDNWRSTSTPHKSFSTLWTGSTHFEVKIPLILPQDWQHAAQYIVAAAAHPLHNYITEDSQLQKDLQMDWNFAFPAHKILGGADPSLTSSASSSAQIPLADRPFAMDEIEDDEDTALGRTQDALKSMDLDHVIDEGMATLHPALRREVLKVHRNLGHPSLQAFIRALRHAGAKKEVVEWTKHHFKCPLCERKQQPSSHRPSHLQKSMNFNEVVGIDLIQLNVPAVGDYILMNCLCWGTDLQIVEPIVNKQANTVFVEFSRSWIAHYGPPALLVADQGREFIGHQFADALGQMGVPIYYTNARSPWENGRTERAGGIFKSRLETTLHEIGATTDTEVRAAIYEVVVAHNRFYNRSGFTPYQRAFGTLPRLPGSLLSDDQIDKQLILEGGGDSMQRSWQIREEAAKAWLRWQDDEAVRRAVSTRTRTSDNKSFDLGELVYIWRNVPGFKGWSGPGTLIAQKDETVWVSMRGYLMKASKAQTRKATSEESRGAELVRHLSAAMLEDLESDKVKLFRDVADEGGPEAEDREDSLSYAPTTPVASPTDDVMDAIIEEVEAEVRQDHQPPGPLEPPDESMPEATESTVGDLPAPPSEVSTEVPMASTSSTTLQDMSRRTSIQVDEGRGGSMTFGPIRDSTHVPAMPYPSPPQGVPSWPRPTSNNFVKSLYLEVSEEPDEISPSWTLDRPTGKYTMRTPSTTKFDIKQASSLVQQQGQMPLPHQDQDISWTSRVQEPQQQAQGDLSEGKSQRSEVIAGFWGHSHPEREGVPGVPEEQSPACAHLSLRR